MHLKNPDHYKKGRKQQGTNTLADIEGRFNRNAPPDDMLPKFEFISFLCDWLAFPD